MLLKSLIKDFVSEVRTAGKVELYNAAGLQHELACFAERKLPPSCFLGRSTATGKIPGAAFFPWVPGMWAFLCLSTAWLQLKPASELKDAILGYAIEWEELLPAAQDNNGP